MLINLPWAYGIDPSPPRSKDMVFYAPTQPDFMFNGATIQIICQPILRALSLHWTLSRNFVKTPLASGVGAGQMDNSFTLDIPTTSLSPGFYDLVVHLALTETQTVTGTTTFGWHADEEQLYPLAPDDFLAFWQQAPKKLDDVPLDLQLEHQFTLSGNAIGQYNIEHAGLPERYDPEGEKYSEVEVSKVDFTSPCGGRVFGWFAKPVGPGPFPGMLVLPGGGPGARPAPVEHARHGYAALDIEAHGNFVDLATYPPHPEMVYETPEQYWHYEVYLNAVQAVTALSNMPGVDSSRLAVTGGSRGGRLSVVVAGLDRRIGAAIPGITHYSYIPWLRWTEELNAEGRNGIEGFRPQDVLRDKQSYVRSYFDVLNFAPLIRCPVLMNMGLIDPVSPATGLYAAYRNITSPKEIVPMPNLGHDWSPTFDRYAWKWLSNIW